jgi:hypothetical protein
MATATPTSTNPGSIFELRYRKGGLIHTLYFPWPSKDGAIEKAKEYCEKRGLRFIYVSEWLTDIQKMIDFDPDGDFKK